MTEGTICLKQVAADQKDDREEETEARRRFRTHSFLEHPCQFLKVIALSVLQNLAVRHTSQPHVPAEDLRWRAELLANGGFWSGVFDLVEKSRRESSVWGKVAARWLALMKRGEFFPSKRPRSAFLKLYSAMTVVNYITIRAIRTGSRIKRQFIETSEVTE